MMFYCTVPGSFALGGTMHASLRVKRRTSGWDLGAAIESGATRTARSRVPAAGPPPRDELEGILTGGAGSA
jgi:hypothetical protein